MPNINIIASFVGWYMDTYINIWEKSSKSEQITLGNMKKCLWQKWAEYIFFRNSLICSMQIFPLRNHLLFVQHALNSANFFLRQLWIYWQCRFVMFLVLSGKQTNYSGWYKNINRLALSSAAFWKEKKVAFLKLGSEEKKNYNYY